MDKKILAGIVDGIVAEVAEKQGLTEGEARAMVGITLKKNKDAIVAAIVSPNLTLPAAA